MKDVVTNLKPFRRPSAALTLPGGRPKLHAVHVPGVPLVPTTSSQSTSQVLFIWKYWYFVEGGQ
jgi:hypothetical protein